MILPLLAETWEEFDDSGRVPDMNGIGWASTDDATFDITGVQLEVGSAATPFEHRSYGDELVRCQRYFQQIDYDTSNGQGSSSADAMWYMYNAGFMTKMRQGPNLVKYSAYGSNTGDALFGNAASGSVTTGINMERVSSTSATIRGNASVTRFLRARVHFSAEL